MSENLNKENMNEKNETKAEKFIKLGLLRTNNARNSIRIVGNLFNKQRYEFSEKQAQMIIKSLEAELKKAKNKLTDCSTDEGFKW